MKLALREIEKQFEFRHLFQERGRVFGKELSVVETQSSQGYFDEWDNGSAINIGAFDGKQLIAGGRIIEFTENLQFRVSSSLNIKEIVGPETEIVEISGLFVLPQYRDLGIGTCIQVFRLELARKLNKKFVIASSFKKTARALSRFGFEVVVPEFLYLPYPEKYQKSCLSIFRVESKQTQEMLKLRAREKLTLELRINLEKSLKSWRKN